MITYHTPVLLDQTIEGLALQPDGGGTLMPRLAGVVMHR
jgi:hypothetical protein